MKIAVFYTNGSNCINVDLYGNDDVLVELYANKTIQASIKVNKSYFNNEKAHVTFNFLMYKYDRYTVVATTKDEHISKAPELVDAPTSSYETNYLEDKLTSETTDTIKEMVAKPIFEQKGEYLVVNLTDSRLVTIGNALVSYSGGGNRYLINDGLLVLQKESCNCIDDTYSPNRLGTAFKAEEKCTNLFNRFTTNSVGKAQVQKGIYADVFTSFEGKLFVDTDWIDFEGETYCYSALMSLQDDSIGTLYCVNEGGVEIPITSETEVDEDMVTNEEPISATISNQYEMVSFVFSLNGKYKLRLKVDLFKNAYNKLFILLPQLEIGRYPTSRVIVGETREKDIISIAPYSTTNMTDGGFVEVSCILGRNITKSEGCVILEWIDSEGNGLRILQDEDNSLIGVINNGDAMDSVTSTPMEIEEGEELSVKVTYNADLIQLSVNGSEYSCERINYKGFPNVKNEVHLGWSDNIPSFDGDFINVKFGK